MDYKRKQYCPKGHDTYIYGRQPNSYCSLCYKTSVRSYNSSTKGKAARTRWYNKQINKPNSKLSQERLAYLIYSCEQAQKYNNIDSELFWIAMVKDPPKVTAPNNSTGARPSAGAPHNIAQIHIGHKQELHRLAQLAKRRGQLDY